MPDEYGSEARAINFMFIFFRNCGNFLDIVIERGEKIVPSFDRIKSKNDDYLHAKVGKFVFMLLKWLLKKRIKIVVSLLVINSSRMDGGLDIYIRRIGY